MIGIAPPGSTTAFEKRRVLSRARHNQGPGKSLGQVLIAPGRRPASLRQSRARDSMGGPGPRLQDPAHLCIEVRDDAVVLGQLLANGL